MAELTAVSPRGIEAQALGGPVTTIGTGPESATTAGTRLAGLLGPGDPVAIVGVADALGGHLWPGHLVVATEVRTLDGAPPLRLAGADLLAEELRRYGHWVHTGPVVSSPHPATPAERQRWAASGAMAVDTESAWLA
ncbi:MAG TPA: hypothetical protein VG205_08715, partial [Acidimicrobiales bacterium]|nr:hypothetical protein [Acidimicrobiales bacterium]